MSKVCISVFYCCPSSPVGNIFLYMQSLLLVSSVFYFKGNFNVITVTLVGCILFLLFLDSVTVYFVRGF